VEVLDVEGHRDERNGRKHIGMNGPFDNLREQRTVVVTTFRRDDTGVPTPVSIVVKDNHAYIRTWYTSGKAKRLRRNCQLDLAPSTFRGKVTGDTIKCHARLLEGEDATLAAKRLADKYPILHGRVVPWIHRRRNYKTVHYELTAA
jgi:PPOX class probable F420-dependent enzyme